MKKLKRFGNRKRNAYALKVSKSLDQIDHPENLLKELEELRKTVADMKQAEKCQLEVCSFCAIVFW